MSMIKSVCLCDIALKLCKKQEVAPQGKLGRGKVESLSLLSNNDI